MRRMLHQPPNFPVDDSIGGRGYSAILFAPSPSLDPITLELVKKTGLQLRRRGVYTNIVRTVEELHKYLPRAVKSVARGQGSALTFVYTGHGTLKEDQEDIWFPVPPPAEVGHSMKS